MKTTIQKSIVIVSLFSFLAFGVSMNLFAESVAEHEALAKKFENLAAEMQAKVEEQKEIVSHKPRSSYFGKHGRNIKSHIAYKIRKYEKEAMKYSQQAANHHAMAAEQAGSKSAASQNHTNSSSNL